MTSIGFRVYSDKKIFYCVLEKLQTGDINYLDISSIDIPRALTWPEALAYTRNTILDILNLYTVKKTAIRIAELDGASIERCYIEGVLQETIASSPVEKFLVGQIAEFTSLLNIPRDNFKKLADNELQFESIPQELDWTKLTKVKRETILTANAALNL